MSPPDSSAEKDTTAPPEGETAHGSIHESARAANVPASSPSYSSTPALNPAVDPELTQALSQLRAAQVRVGIPEAVELPDLSVTRLTLISQLLETRSLSLRFQDNALEQSYLQLRAYEFAGIMRVLWPLILILFVMLLGLGSQFYPADMLDSGYHFILTIWLPCVVIISLTAGMTWLRRFHRYFEWLVGFACILVLTLLVRAVLEAHSRDFEMHSLINVQLVIMILGFGTRLRLLAQFITLSIAITAVMVLALMGDYHLGWLKLGHYVGIFSIAMLLLSAMVESRDRHAFLGNVLMLSREHGYQQLERRLNRLTSEDMLCRIPNRRACDELLLREWERSRREQQTLALLYLDIDYFRQFNDHYGSIAADRALYQLAQLMVQTLWRPADQVGRYGGDEFMILLPNTDPEGAEQVARRMIQAVDALAIEHRWSQVAGYLTVSVGIALTTPEDDSQWDLVRRAEQALARAKQQGRHQKYLLNAAQV